MAEKNSITLDPITITRPLAPQLFGGDRTPRGGPLIPDFLKGILGQTSETVQQEPVVPLSPTGSGGQEELEVEEVDNARNNMIKNLLLRLAIPVGSAIAGSVNPNLLPQAAGLAGGFVEGQQTQQELAGRQALEESKRQPTEFDIEKEAANRAADRFRSGVIAPSAEEYAAEIDRQRKVLQAQFKVPGKRKKPGEKAREIEDKFSRFRGQLEKGEILIQRGNKIMAVQEGENVEGDKRL